MLDFKKRRDEPSIFLAFEAPARTVMQLDEMRQDATFTAGMRLREDGIPTRSEMLRTLVSLGLEALQRKRERQERRRRREKTGV
jgi:hypothetical protein